MDNKKEEISNKIKTLDLNHDVDLVVAVDHADTFNVFSVVDHVVQGWIKAAKVPVKKLVFIINFKKHLIIIFLFDTQNKNDGQQNQEGQSDGDQQQQQDGQQQSGFRHNGNRRFDDGFNRRRGGFRSRGGRGRGRGKFGQRNNGGWGDQQQLGNDDNQDNGDNVGANNSGNGSDGAAGETSN